MWLSLIPGEEKHLPPLTVFGLKAHPLSLASSSDPWPCTPVPWENTLFIKDPGGSESTLHWFHQQIWTLTISAPITEHKYVRLLDKCGLVFKFFFFFFIYLFFFRLGLWPMEFPRQGLNPSQTCNLHDSCSNAGSLTHCAGLGIELASLIAASIPLRHSRNSSYGFDEVRIWFLALIR